MHYFLSAFAFVSIVICVIDFLTWPWQKKTKAILIVLGVMIFFVALNYALNYDDIMKRDRLDDDVKALREEMQREGFKE